VITSIAQVASPADGLSTGLFMPLVLGTVVYVLVLIASTVLEGRGDARGRVLGDVAFVILLLLGVYTAILLIMALASEFNLIVDMIQIIGIVVVFFALILVALFGVSLLFGVLGRAMKRKKRVTTG
jgi:hypothetical protein